MNPSMKNILDMVINGEENRSHTPIPLLTSNARVRSATPVQDHMADTEMKRNAAQMDETKHTKQRFKMPVSTMSAACSICNKTSQSGVGGICKGCWGQFQAKGVRIGNIEEFMQFTETVKSNVSRIVTVKNKDEQSSNNQAPIVDSLREVIPSMFFKDKHKKPTDTTASRSIGVENVNKEGGDSQKKAISRSSGSNGEEQNCPTETPSRAESTDHSHVSHKPTLVRNQSITRSKTFVDSSKSNTSDNDSKQNHEQENSNEVNKRVSRTKTQISMKNNSDRSLKPTVSDINNKPTEKSQSVSSEKAAVSTNNLKCKRSESEHMDPGKHERGSRTQINDKRKYEPTTVRQSSKLNLSKFDNRDRKTDVRYSNSTKQISHKRSDHKASGSRSGYDNNIKLGTRSMKGNALRQMAGNSEHRSSTDEDTDEDNKSKKEGYKQLDDIKMPTHNKYITSIRDKIHKKQSSKEVKTTPGYSSFSVQNKYSSYSQLNTDKSEQNNGDGHNTNESIYFSEKSLVSTLSNFINKTECFKTPAIEQTSTQFQQQAKDLYYNNGASMSQKHSIHSTDDYEKYKSKDVYFDKPSSITADVSSDYTVYKHGIGGEVSNYNYSKAIDFGTTNSIVTSSAGRSELQESLYTEGSIKYGSYSGNTDIKSENYAQRSSIAAKQSEDNFYTGGLNSKGYETNDTYTNPISGNCKGFIESANKDHKNMVKGESYNGLRSLSLMRSSDADVSYTSENTFDATSVNQHIIKPIFPRQGIEAAPPEIKKPTLIQSIPKEEKSPTETRKSNKSSRMFRKRNKVMDEMVEKSIDSAGEFFTKAMVSFKNPFNNFNSNSNLWYGNERNALTGACQDDMSFEKPNYTEWKPEIKPIFNKPKPKKANEPLVLDFLKYERQNEGYEERYERDDDIQTDEWYAGTQEGFHGPLNTTWDGRNWKKNEENSQQEQDRGVDEESEEYTDKKHCRVCPVCPNNNNSTLLVCNINNNYPDYDKYDKPMVQVQKKVPKVEVMGNDRDYAPMLYSVPDNFMHRSAPSPVNFKPPSPPVQKKSYESSYFFSPQSQCDEEPEYAGYEKRREVEIPKEPSPPPAPKIIKVGSIFIRNNVENDFDYAENVNRDLNDESFGAMGFNQRAQEFNSIPFPHNTDYTPLMADSGNRVQIQDVHQAIHRDREWSSQKAPADVLPAYMPPRSAPTLMKMEMPPQKDHEEPIKKTTKSSKTRTTSVTSDAVNRRASAKEPSSELEPIKKPTFPRNPNIVSGNQKKQSTPRPPPSTQRKEYTPRNQSKPLESRKPQASRHSYNESKRKDKNKEHHQERLLSKIFTKPLKFVGIIGGEKKEKTK